jgi:aspartate kinase
MTLVMKFGGASVKDAENVKNVAKIILSHQNYATLIVISAMDKTTNELEFLAELAEQGKEAESQTQYQKIQDFHLKIVNELFEEEKQLEDCKIALQTYFQEMSRTVKGILYLNEFPPLTYDKIVSFGELLSTTIVYHYLKSLSNEVLFWDARRLIRTDMRYGQGKVIWSLTQENINNQLLSAMKSNSIVITQGFIGATIAGKTTTLGREGSDYSAAIFAYCLNAEKMIVWKDVPGILNADPRIKPDAIKIDQLSYHQAVEMTFYGATVIHPKTIQPLYNKNIPLYVKSFKDTSLSGTCISTEKDLHEIPKYIMKKKQTFVQITPKDFSFMDEAHLQEIFQQANQVGLKVNLSQTSAISLFLAVDESANPLQKFEAGLTELFHFVFKQDLVLHTVLNYQEEDKILANNALIAQYSGNKMCILLPKS